MGDCETSVQVKDVLSENQVKHIMDKCVGPDWQLVGSTLRPAGEGLGGFMGDHFRLILQVQVDGQLRTLKFFVKSVPRLNPVKIEFIQENGFFTREKTMFKLMDEIDLGPIPWAPKGLFYDETVMVMPDLAPEGYSVRNHLQTFDLPHVLVTLASVARFHAAIANHETRKGLNLQRSYSLMEDHGQVIIECSLQDTPWIRTAAKLTADITQRLSKYKDTIPDLKASVLKQFLAGFKDLTEKDSLNVVIHKDLWVNNIMFKYEDGVPTNSILVDFQCIRYGPPAFDIAVFLYMTTSRSFREQHKDQYLRHYFDIFMECVDVETKLRLKGLGYDYEDFLRWMEVSKRFGMAATLVLLPYVLMDPLSASEVFNDPETFERIAFVDRTEAVLAHAVRCPEYGRRQVELTEEFIERCLRPKWTDDSSSTNCF